MDGYGVSEKRLNVFLQMAVPMWVEKVRNYSEDQMLKRRSACANIISGQGDVILYGSKKKGRCANAFNHLAEGIAILSVIAEGGVEAFGTKYDWDEELEEMLKL